MSAIWSLICSVPYRIYSIIERNCFAIAAMILNWSLRHNIYIAPCVWLSNDDANVVFSMLGAASRDKIKLAFCSFLWMFALKESKCICWHTQTGQVLCGGDEHAPCFLIRSAKCAITMCIYTRWWSPASGVRFHSNYLPCLWVKTIAGFFRVQILRWRFVWCCIWAHCANLSKYN